MIGKELVGSFSENEAGVAAKKGKPVKTLLRVLFCVVRYGNNGSNIHW